MDIEDTQPLEKVGSQPPLVIDFIELTNFKSYAGVVKVGPFHHRLTAVIGPNGSGKSNIIDALLFVFGRRAMQLRQKNLTGLIHSSKNCNPDHAKVTVRFCRSHKATAGSSPKLRESEDSREFAFNLSRQIWSNGSSKYTINDETVTHSQMADFVKRQGIDLDHNRFLILQGEVEHFSQLPPKGVGDSNSSGLLEILEDLFGSNDLMPIIQELETQCETLKEALDSSEAVLTRATAELSGLVGPCREAYGYINSHKQLLAAKADLEAKERWTLRAKKDEYATEMCKVEQQLEALTETELKQYSSKMEEIGKVSSQHNMAHKELVDRAGDLKNEISGLRLDEDRIAAAISSHEKAIDEQTSKIRELDREAKEKTEECQRIIVEGEYERDQGIPSLQQEYDVIKSDMAKLDEALKEESASINKKLAVLLDEKAVIDLKASDIDKKRAEAESRLELKRSERKAKDLDNLKANLKACRSKLEEKVSKIDEMVVNRNELIAVINKRAESNRTLQTKLDSLDSKRQVLQTKLTAMAPGGRVPKSSVLLTTLRKEFLNAQSPLYETGYWLLDYITVEDMDKYGCALTAGGLNEDIVLTQSDEHSEQIIRYVKKCNLGRVTCVTVPTAIQRWKPLMSEWRKNLAKSRNLDERQAKPLMDFMQVKPFGGDGIDISCIAWSRIRDTLLCIGGDINLARKIAFGGKERHRVVTLKGEIIEKNGSMTGGCSSNYLKQRPSLFASETIQGARGEDPAAIEREVRKIEEEIDKLRFATRSSGYDESRMKQQAAELQKDIDVAINEGKELEKIYCDLKEVLSRKTEELKSVESQKKFKQLEDEIASLETEFEKINKERTKTKASQTALQNQINVESERLKNLGGVKRAKMQQRKIKLEDDLATKSSLVNNMVSLSSAAKQRSKQIVEVLIPDANIRLETLNEELETKRRLFDCTVEALSKAQKEYNAVAEKTKCLEELIQEIKQERVQIDHVFKKVQAAQKDLEDRMSELKMECTSLDRAIATKTNVIRQLRVDFDEFIKFGRSFALQILPLDQDNVNALEEQSSQTEPEAAPAIDDKPHQKLEIVSFPNVDSDDRFEERPTVSAFPMTRILQSEFQMNVHKWSANVEALGNQTTDVMVLNRFRAKNEEVINLTAERNRRKDELESNYSLLQARKNERRQIFDKGFTFLSDKVKELYQMLTRGGDGELEYKACHCPFSEGIEYSVRPPGKSWRSINKLSGGEKTLSSLALIFALHYYKPTPIYVLDEIDAALDTQNVILIASYVAACQASQAQFIVVSLRHEFFQRADRLIGVCKVADKTRICVIDPDEIAEPENKRPLEQPLS